MVRERLSLRTSLLANRRESDHRRFLLRSKLWPIGFKRPPKRSHHLRNGESTEVTDVGLETIGELTRLESLNLAGTAINGRGLAHLAKLDKLRDLDLRDTVIQPKHLQTLSALTSLRTIHLPEAVITDDVLAVLGRLAHLRSLVLAKAPVSDRGLASLVRLKQLETLDLSETGITDTGLTHLAELTNLRQLRLAHAQITGAGLSHLARLTSLQELDLAETAVDDAGLAHLADMRRLATLQLTGTQVRGYGLARLRTCQQLRAVSLPPIPAAAVEAVNAVKSWHKLSLESLDMKVTEVTGEPIPITELHGLPHTLDARIRLETVDASWLLRLIGKMPALKRLDLRARGLTAAALSPLSTCTQLEYLGVRGIDDPGEPLKFLNGMPKLDQCLVLGCPRVGRIRLTKQAGVRRLYFKYGRLDELAVNGAPNLTAVYLGHEAFGYNDADARLNKLDIGSLAVRDTANLLYLMVDGLESMVPFTGISLADTPKLRSLLLRAPPAERQPTKCRLITEGAFPKLVQRRLFHLRADQASLDRLNDSPILHGGDMEDVEVDALLDEPFRATAQLPELEAEPLSAAVMAQWQQAGALFGWCTIDAQGDWQFHRERPASGGLPAFRFSRFPAEKVSSLATPEVPFGLWLGRSTRGDQDLDELARFKRLQALNLEGTYAYSVTDKGLKALTPLTGLQALSLEHTAHTDAGMTHIAALKQLRILTLGRLVDVGLGELAALEHLHTLHIISTSVTDAGMKALPRLKALRTLTILSSGGGVSDAGLNELGKMTQLQALSLRHTTLKHEHLQVLGRLKQLESLDLFWTDTTDAGLKELAGLTQLRSLNLGWNYQVTDAGLTAVSGLKQLETLRLDKTKVTEAGLKELAGLKHLRTLSFGDTRVTDAGLAELAGLEQLQSLRVSQEITDAGLKDLAKLKLLQRLELTFCQITDTGLEELAGLGQLQYLRLFSTKVTDAGLKQLAGLSQLQSLNLDGTRVTDASVSELLGFQKLRSLHLPSRTTDAVIRELQQALPATTITASRLPL